MTEAPKETGTTEPGRARRLASRLAWGLCAIPFVGVVELGMHVEQTTSGVVPEADWKAARDAVKADFHDGDTVVFAPFWADPLGREAFGEELTGIRREAAPDETRFARAFEVSIRGAHAPELARWKKVSERDVGKVKVTLLENPAPAKVLTDLVAQTKPSSLSVAHVDASGEAPCSFQRGQGQPGGLAVPQGPAVPGARFTCPGGGYVGVAVLHALDHHPHQCVFATSPGGAATLKLTFKDVAFGESLHGHHGVQWVSERNAPGTRIALRFSAFDRTIGESSHRIGAGWTGFELPTPELAGKRGDLVVEVSGPSERYFCFEADTR